MVFESERMSGAYDGPNRMAINTYDEGWSEYECSNNNAAAAAALHQQRTHWFYWLTFGKQMFSLCPMPNWLFPFRTCVFFSFSSFRLLHVSIQAANIELSFSFVFFFVLAKHSQFSSARNAEQCETREKINKNRRTEKKKTNRKSHFMVDCDAVKSKVLQLRQTNINIYSNAINYGFFFLCVSFSPRSFEHKWKWSNYILVFFFSWLLTENWCRHWKSARNCWENLKISDEWTVNSILVYGRRMLRMRKSRNSYIYMQREQ